MTPRARQPQTRRIDRGQGHSYQVDGVKFDGVTTLIKKAVPIQLAAWGAEQGAQWLLDNRSAIGTISDELLLRQARDAPFKERVRAAVKGSDVHLFAQRIASGEEVEVPDAALGFVDTYIDWTEKWRPTQEITERTIINRRYRFCGTFDLWCVLPDLGRTLVDYKTGAGGVYAETALQLAAYGMGETMMVPPSSNEEPLPPIDSYAVLWLMHDGWEFYRYDVGEHERRTFLYVMETARWLTKRANWKDAANNVKGAPLERPGRAQLQVVER